MLKRPINIASLVISFFVIVFLTILSFFGAWAFDERTGNSSILVSFYKIFRFPTHTLLWDFFSRTSATFYLGLLLNIIFYAFVIERLSSIFKQKKV